MFHMLGRFAFTSSLSRRTSSGLSTGVTRFGSCFCKSGPLSQKQDPNRVSPVDKPELDLLEKDEVKVKRPSMWNIVFYNDDYTPINFVEFVIKKVFHISTLDALALTLAVHTKGKGIAGTYTFEVAEQKQYEVLSIAKVEEHPLRVEVERV